MSLSESTAELRSDLDLEATQAVGVRGAVTAWTGVRLERLRSMQAVWTRADRAAVLIILASLIPRLWTLLQSWFWQDDFVIASMAARDGMGLDFLMQDYSGHLMPALMAVMGMSAILAPGNWTVVVVVVSLLAVVAGSAWWWALRTVFGPRLSLLIPLAIIVFCPLQTIAVGWWASALQQLPLQIAMAVAVVGHVRLVRDGRRDGLVLAIVAIVIGLAWFEKALLILPVLAWIDLVLLRGGALVSTLRRRLVSWGAYAALALAYFGLYRWRVDAPTELSSPFADVTRFLYESVLSTFPVGLLGGPWQAQTDSNTLLHLVTQPWLMFVWVLVVAVVAASMAQRGWRAWRGWSLIIGYLAVAVGLVAATRLDFVGPVIGRDPRYLTDAIPVAALALAAAFLPALSVPDPPWARDLRVSDRRLAPWGVGLLVVVYFLSSWISTYEIAGARGSTGAREWADEVRSNLSRNENVVLYDVEVPEFVVARIFGADALQSSVLAGIGPEPAFNQPTVDPRIVDGSGVVQPAQLIVESSAKDGPVQDCGWLAQGRPVTIRLAKPEEGSNWVLRLGYFSNAPTEPLIDVGDESWSVPLPEGLNELSLFPTGDVSAVRISGLDVDQSICITNVDIGRGWPEGEPLLPGDN